MSVLFAGILSSLIASIVYALLSFTIKPRIKISDKICVTKNKDGSYMYKIKVVNMSKAQLVNVSYSLNYGFSGRDDISYITEILPKKPPMSTLAKNSKKNTDYALRVTYDINDGEYVCDNDAYFDFIVQATHPFSNSIACKTKRYRKDDIVYDCTFQIGESIEIIDLRVPDTTGQRRVAQV